MFVQQSSELPVSLHTRTKTRFTELKKLFTREHNAVGAAIPTALPSSRGRGKAEVTVPAAAAQTPCPGGHDQQGATPETTLTKHRAFLNSDCITNPPETPLLQGN